AAQNRRALVDAHGVVRAAELALAQLLDRPLDASIVLLDEDPASLLAGFPFARTVGDPELFEPFVDAHIERALAVSPGIAALDTLIAAGERRLDAANRAFYLPEAVLAASWTVDVAEGGEGTEPPTIELPGDFEVFPDPPDDRWSLAIRASLPILTGGERIAERVQADLDLQATTEQGALARSRAEQRARTALAFLETSHEAARQAADAADASQRAFDIVLDGYREGAETLTTLLNAQSASLVARLIAADAVYTFYLRWLELQRAVGGFYRLDAAADTFATDLRQLMETR
ncbi:MAG: TolC family protein, partial [Acidobacteriota bacterium]